MQENHQSTSLPPKIHFPNKLFNRANCSLKCCTVTVCHSSKNRNKEFVLNATICKIDCYNRYCFRLDGDTGKILTLRLTAYENFVNIVRILPPTLKATSKAKRQFYAHLDSVVKCILTYENIYLLGNANARLDAESWSKHVMWPWYWENEWEWAKTPRVLLKLCLTNTCFFYMPCHKAFWKHLWSNHWHQLNLAIINRDSLNSVPNIRAYHSADCDTENLIPSK